MTLNLYSWIALGAVIFGGIVLGLLGLTNINLVTSLFGELLGRLLFVGIGGGAGYLGYQIYLTKFKKA
jgi:uncharacterized membrane protein YuzA (DUF378 family)